MELKSDALKERHWRQLMRKLRVNWVLSEVSLGQVWDVDLQANEAVVKDIILTAQGEMALEEFLRQASVVGSSLVALKFPIKDNRIYLFFFVRSENHGRIMCWI